MNIVTQGIITVVVGEQATIPCYSSNTGRVVWSRVNDSALGGRDEVLTVDGTVTTEFIGRVSIHITESGDQNLLISNVTLDDARLYRCATAKDGTEHHVVLQVIQG